MDYTDMPIGFGLNLESNELALNAFNSLAEAQRQAIIARAREAQTEDEVQALISTLTQRTVF